MNDCVYLKTLEVSLNGYLEKLQEFMVLDLMRYNYTGWNFYTRHHVDSIQSRSGADTEEAESSNNNAGALIGISTSS